MSYQDTMRHMTKIHGVPAEIEPAGPECEPKILPLGQTAWSQLI
jgi:hypothetical protein